MLINESSIRFALDLGTEENILSPVWDVRGGSNDEWLATDGLYFVDTKKLDRFVLEYILEKQPQITDRAYRLLKLSGHSERIAEYLTWCYKKHLEDSYQ